MIAFQEYIQESLRGVLSNELLIGIMLALIVTLLREEYVKIRDKLNSKRKLSLLTKILMEIIFLIFIIPASLVILIILFFFFWLISLLGV
jgi:hypothetical protein